MQALVWKNSPLIRILFESKHMSMLLICATKLGNVNKHKNLLTNYVKYSLQKTDNTNPTWIQIITHSQTVNTIYITLQY